MPTIAFSVDLDPHSWDSWWSHFSKISMGLRKHPQKAGTKSEPSPEKSIISVTLEKNISKMVVQQANNQPPGFATLQKIPVIFP